MTTVCATSEFLQHWASGESTSKFELYEFRLLLSGCAYNGDLQGDPAKSEKGRILLEEPVELLTAALPFSEYPQEIVLRIRTGNKQIETERITANYLPQNEIVGGLASLLTIYMRRLIVVCGQSNFYVSDDCQMPSILKQIPAPIIANGRKAVFWPKLPLNTVTWPSGTTYENPNPDAVATSPEKLKEFLATIGRHRHSQKLIAAAHLYHRGLEVLFSQPDISYLLFVFAADSLAHIAYPSLERTEAERLDSRVAKKFRAVAEKLNLTPESIQTLCVAATEPIKLKSRGELFLQFFERFGKGHESTASIFNTGNNLDLLNVQDEKTAIVQAYKARSGYVHSAKQFRDSAFLGTSSSISIFAMLELFIDEERAPPIVWLERIVAVSFQNFINDPQDG